MSKGINANADPTRESPDLPPIFIVGFGRSGTTLLQLMLSAHPRIAICFETHFYMLPRPKIQLADFIRAFFRTGSGIYLRIDPENVIAQLPRSLPSNEYWKVFREIMRQRAAKFDRVRYGDKTPSHTFKLKEIFRDFPNARVILMVRDPRSAVLSTIRMPWGSSRDLPNSLVYEWTYRCTKAFADRMLQVRLEDLQRDPRTQMQRVLDFVGEEWSDDVLDHAAKNPDPIPVPPVPFLENSARPVEVDSARPWRNMSPTRVRTVEWLCRRSMKSYGYAPAELQNEPERGTVWRQIISEIPEGIRYFLAMARLCRHWSRLENLALDDARSRELIMKVNPSCWQYYPDFIWPDAAQLAGEVRALGIE